MTLSQIAGILPAVVFPAATAFQLFRIVQARTAAGVSVSTWTLFGCANIAMYFYAERYTEWQSIVGMLFTAVLDFGIAALAIVAAARRRTELARQAIPAAERVEREELTLQD